MSLTRLHCASNPAILVAAALCLALCACASAPAKRGAEADPVGAAISQPFKDLSLVREATPEPLLRAVVAPYRAATPADCAAVRAELASLNAALGPDLDTRQASAGADGQGLVSDALKSVVSLPFRGLVRRISGAQKRDLAQAQAVLAGVARRGFFRGLARGAGCEIRP